MKSGPLAVKRIPTLPPGRHHDSNCLYLVVASGGSRSWVLRTVFRGRRVERGLGGWPRTSPKIARQKRDQILAEIAAGSDPWAGPSEPVPIWKDAVSQFSERLDYAHPRDEQAWLRAMETYTFPSLGDRPVDQIERSDVVRILEPMVQTHSPTSVEKMRRRIQQVLAWAEAKQLVPGPVGPITDRDQIHRALNLTMRETHQRSLDYREAPDFFAALKARAEVSAVALLLRWILVTAVRSGEARGAVWSEIDQGKNSWTIPSARMTRKGRKGQLPPPHTVPLSPQALEALNEARVQFGSSGLIFPSPTGAGTRPLSESAGRMLLIDLGYWDRTNIHGLRSTFRTWATEESLADWAVAESSLAHRPAQTERAYARGTAIKARTWLMDAWGHYLETGKTRTWPGASVL